MEDDEARHPIWSLFGSRVFKRIVPRLLFGCVWCSVVSCLYHFFPYFHHFKGFTHTITGTFLGLLIAFRTNEGYARYWEARNAWAQCGCMCRRLAMLLASSVNGNAQVTERVFQLLQAFPFALKQHLRGQRSEADLGKILGRQDLQSLESSNNVPARLCFMLTEATLPLLYEESRVVWMKAERQIQELSIIVGVMERLATTPVPLSYSRHTSRFLSLWTITLPFYLCSQYGPFTAFLVHPVICWALIGTEEVGHIIEEPFGTPPLRGFPWDSERLKFSENLPLLRYCDQIRRDVRDIETEWANQAFSPEMCLLPTDLDDGGLSSE